MSLKSVQRRIIRLLALLVGLAILFCFGLYAYRTFFGYQYDSSLFEADLSAGTQTDKSVTNLVLFGLDTREGDTQSRSDCMMLVSVDNAHGKIKLISLMRDSLVTVDGYGEQKLNAAYAFGGPALAIRTINQCFGVGVQDYISVNFEQLVEIINALEGVEIDVQDYELAELNRVIRDYGLEQGETFAEVEQAGYQTLDGVQALCYGRIRKGGTGDDWGRVERQSIVLSAMFSKVESLSLRRLLALVQKLVPYVTTSLSPAELAPLAAGAMQGGMPALSHTRVPLDGEWSYGGASSEYIVYDLQQAADHIRAYIYDDVFPGESPLSGTNGGEQQDASDAPAYGGAAAFDPASLAEEGGRYDAETGDYYDSEGDRYYLDENGSRVYYAD